MRLVRSIRETLSFKADSASCREGSTVCTFESVEPVSGIELYTGFRCIYFHETSAFRILAGRGQLKRTALCLVQYVAMVISCAEYQLLELIIDTFAYGVRSTEIHRCSFYFGYFSGRDGNFVNRCIEISADSNDMVVDSRSGSGYAGKIEETAIGQIDYCSLVRCSAIFNIQSIHLVIQAVSHFYFQITGEPLFAVGGNIIELHCTLINLNSVPYAGVETGRSSMQGVLSVVDGEFMFFAEQGEFSFGDTVAVASDSSAEE